MGSEAGATLAEASQLASLQLSLVQAWFVLNASEEQLGRQLSFRSPLGFCWVAGLCCLRLWFNAGVIVGLVLAAGSLLLFLASSGP